MEEPEVNYDTKKKYVYENIIKIANHKNYLEIIKYHNCPHTNNSNGIFINLNTVHECVIHELYYKLKNELEDNTFINHINEKKVIETEIEELFKYKKPFEEIKYDIIKLEDFPKEQHEIIELSKKYKI